MPTNVDFAHGQFSWVDLMAHDAEAAKTFYAGLFGWTTTLASPDGPPYYFFEYNGHQVGGMGQMSDEMKSQGVPAMWNTYVNVDNIESIVAKVVELGGTVVMPPMQVMEAGSMAILQDPTGARLCVWQKNQHAGAQLIGEPVSFCWNELATRDLEAAKSFYGALFGWEFAKHDAGLTEYFLIKNNGQDIGGVMLMDSAWGEAPPRWSVYFSVEDTVATADKLADLGGVTIIPPFDIPVGRMAIVTDPQGAAFNLIQLAEQPGA